MKVVQISESEFSVQGHGVHTAYIETVAALRAQPDVEVATNTFAAADVRHINTVGIYSLVQLLVGRGVKIVSAHVVPNSFVGSLVGAKYWLWAAKIYLRWFYNRARTVIAVSDATKNELLRLGVKRPISVVYNMIDTSRYTHSTIEHQRLRQKFGFTASDIVVVSNGQVQPRKRVDTFLKIAAELPEYKFVWVGGIPFGRAADDYAAMQRLMQTAPTNVIFTGVVPLDQVREYFAAADIFVMPSDQETFGLAIVEAAASGLPVILRDIADYDQTFRDDAVMCAEDDFVRAVTRLATDPTYYKEMTTHAARIAARYDSRQVSDQLIAVYRDALHH